MVGSEASAKNKLEISNKSESICLQIKVKVYVYRLDIQPLEGGPMGAKAPIGEQIRVERRENHGHLPGNLLSLCPGIVFAN